MVPIPVNATPRKKSLLPNPSDMFSLLFIVFPFWLIECGLGMKLVRIVVFKGVGKITLHLLSCKRSGGIISPKKGDFDESQQSIKAEYPRWLSQSDCEHKRSNPGSVRHGPDCFAAGALACWHSCDTEETPLCCAFF
jgi:hypothetical protein